LDHGLYAIETLPCRHRACHGSFAGWDEITLQALDPEGATEPLRGIQKARGSAPKLGGAPVNAKNMAIDVAGVNADRQRIKDGLVQFQKGLEQGGPVRYVEPEQGHERLKIIPNPIRQRAAVSEKNDRNRQSLLVKSSRWNLEGYAALLIADI
jgi:hypothetical protein